MNINQLQSYVIGYVDGDDANDYNNGIDYKAREGYKLFAVSESGWDLGEISYIAVEDAEIRIMFVCEDGGTRVLIGSDVNEIDLPIKVYKQLDV